MYAKSYYQMRRRNALERAIAYQQEYRRVMERASGHYVLDYGCGEGDFLEKFTGWTRYGVEISQYAKEQSQKKGVMVVDTWDIKDHSLDLVIFRGVLQHIDEPFTALREAERMLRNGGLIAILAQPDADSLCYKLFGDLPALDPPRNWWIPGRRELTNILHKLNFRNIEVLRPYWGGPYAQPVRDFWLFALRLLGISKKPFAFPGNMIEVYARKGYH